MSLPPGDDATPTKRRRQRNQRKKKSLSTDNAAAGNNNTSNTRHQPSSNDNGIHHAARRQPRVKNPQRDHAESQNNSKNHDNHNGIIASGGSDNEENGTSSTAVLNWSLAAPHVPLAAEEEMVKVVIRWGANERGMLCKQPEFRLADIQKCCKRNGVHISQACSLRRHHMGLLNPFKSKESLRLGTNKNIRKSAELFEQAIASFLVHRQIPFFSETEQKEQFLQDNPGQLVPGTPDFKMKGPIVLKVYSVHNDSDKNQKKRHGKNNRHTNTNNGINHHHHHQGHSNQKRQLVSERTIHWLEAKMFYGASTIPHDNKSAVGSILGKMGKYVELFGTGAIVFMQGCGEQLAAELDEIGVTALTVVGNDDIDLSAVERHQRTWCANQNGDILP